MESVIIGLVAKYPVIATILLVLGVARAIVKPIMSVLQAYVLATPSVKDDETVKKIESSKVYLAIVWLLDYTLSLKLPK